MTTQVADQTDSYIGAPPWLSFQLRDEFVERFRNIKPPFGGTLGYATYLRTYSRGDNPRLPELPDNLCPPDEPNSEEPDVFARRRYQEDWVDTCRRVIEGMHTIEREWCLSHGINYNDDKAQAAAEEAFELMFYIKWTPPGRGISMMGTRFVHERGIVEALQNCGFVSTGVDFDPKDPGYHFAWLMKMSMVGAGIGFDVDGAKISPMKVKGYKGFEQESTVIEDSREGWCEFIRKTINACILGLPLPIPDYSLIRPKGSRIRGFGGTASGPDELKKCVENTIMVLERNKGKNLSSRTITDVFNILGVCVVSGNARRSAEIAIGDPDDKEFINLKYPQAYGGWDGLFEERPWNYMSNNSVKVKVTGDATYYLELARRTWENGEPGFIWMENVHNYARMNKIIDGSDWKARGFNPCVEQPLEPWEMCTLTEMYMPNIVSVAEARLVVKHAYRYAKIVTLANEKITDKRSREVMTRNRRIGLSPTGITQYEAVHGREELIHWLNSMYAHVDRYDALYSQWYKVGRSIRMTSVKPSGTVGTMAGVTPGIHYSVAGRYFIRRVNYAAGSRLAMMLQEAGYPAEPSVHDPETWVFSFPIDMGADVKSQQDVTLREQFELHAVLARYWAGNSVSQTVSFQRDRDTPEDIANILAEFDNQIKAVALLPVEHGYEQAPYEPITEEQYKKYRAAVKDLDLPVEARYGFHDKDDKYCDGDKCEIEVFRVGE